MRACAAASVGLPARPSAIERVELRVAVALPPVVARPFDGDVAWRRASRRRPSAAAAARVSKFAQPAASSAASASGGRARRDANESSRWLLDRDRQRRLDVGEHAAQEVLERLELLRREAAQQRRCRTRARPNGISRHRRSPSAVSSSCTTRRSFGHGVRRTQALGLEPVEHARHRAGVHACRARDLRGGGADAVVDASAADPTARR